MIKVNKYKRYIKIFGIQIFGIKLSYSIGNPLWFIQEFKNIHQVNRSSEVDQALNTMKHWVDFEKENTDKIECADDLINIQETILQYIQDLEQENKKLKKKGGLK